MTSRQPVEGFPRFARTLQDADLLRAWKRDNLAPMRLAALLLLVAAVPACNNAGTSKCNEDRTKAMAALAALGKCRKDFQGSWETITTGSGTSDQKFALVATAEAVRHSCEVGAWNASGLAIPKP